MSLLLALVGPAAPPATIGARFALAAVARRQFAEEEDGAVRTDHNRRLLFGRATVVVATGGAPWYLWPPGVNRTEPEDDARRNDHTLLHRSRVGYQTVGQGYRLWKPSAKFDQAEDGEQRASLATLHQYRSTTTVVRQPFFMWARNGQAVEPELDDQRADHARLHRYRTGYQTVGQPFSLWRKPVSWAEESDTGTQRRTGLLDFRQSVTTPTAQPQRLWLWAKAPIDDQSQEQNPAQPNYAVRMQMFRGTAGAVVSALEWPTVWTWTDRPNWVWSPTKNLWVVRSLSDKYKWRWSEVDGQWVITL